MIEWKFIALSVQGPKHLARAVACQDASQVVWDEQLKSLFLVAADGAGSASRASKAAKHLVEFLAATAPELLKQHMSILNHREQLEAYLITLAELGRAELGTLTATDPDLTLNDFATTLITVVCTPEYIAALQIGDGYILYATDEAEIRIVFKPSKGRFANETYFLTSFASFSDLAASGHLQVTVEERGTVCGVALVTDGLDPLVLKSHSTKPNPLFFVQAMQQLWKDDPHEFSGVLLNFLRESEKLKEVSDDDRTLVLAVYVDGPTIFSVKPEQEERRTITTQSELQKAKSTRPKVIPLHDSTSNEVA